MLSEKQIDDDMFDLCCTFDTQLRICHISESAVKIDQPLGRVQKIIGL
jgi:hypothetical protein